MGCATERDQLGSFSARSIAPEARPRAQGIREGIGLELLEPRSAQPRQPGLSMQTWEAAGARVVPVY